MKVETADILFANNPNPMWIYDLKDLSIKQVNEAACDLYGYSFEEFLTLTIEDLRSAEEIPKLKEGISKQIDSFNNAGIWKHRKKNGELLFVRVLSHTISQEGSQYKLVTAQDVTNKIQYRQELHMLLENSLDGIMLTSPDGRIHKANKAACQMLGMSEEQIIDSGRDGLVFNDEKFQTALKNRKQTGEFSGELTFIHSSGRKIPVELTTSVYKNPQGQLRTSMIFRDITQRKETEQKLKDVIDHSTNMFYRHDVNHVLTYVSPQSEEFLGCSPEEAKHKWTEFITEHPINQKGIKHTQKAIDTGESQPPHQLQLQKKTGEIIWVRVSEAPILEDGKTVAIVGSLSDITQQKQRETQLQESLKEKETLLAEIHHRVKNNLAVVSGMIQLQAFQEEDESLKHKLNNSVGRIKTIANIHELLYSSNNFSRLNLDENIEKLVTDIAQTYQPAIKLEIAFDLQKIDLNINQAIPASLIINEVVTNVFKHAFDENHHGKLWVTMTENDNTVSLQITDDGKGLTANFNIKGNTGSLGMQLIDTLTQQLDGDYQYESDKGKTHFKLTFKKKVANGSGSDFLK